MLKGTHVIVFRFFLSICTEVTRNNENSWIYTIAPLVEALFLAWIISTKVSIRAPLTKTNNVIHLPLYPILVPQNPSLQS